MVGGCSSVGDDVNKSRMILRANTPTVTSVSHTHAITPSPSTHRHNCFWGKNWEGEDIDRLEFANFPKNIRIHLQVKIKVPSSLYRIGRRIE